MGEIVSCKKQILASVAALQPEKDVPVILLHRIQSTQPLCTTRSYLWIGEGIVDHSSESRRTSYLQKCYSRGTGADGRVYTCAQVPEAICGVTNAKECNAYQPLQSQTAEKP